MGAEDGELFLMPAIEPANPSKDLRATPLAATRLLFTYEEAAHMLGMKHRNTVYNLVKRGELKPTYVSGRPRISKATLLEYIERNTEI